MQRLKAKLTPEGFHAFFVEHRLHKVRTGEPGYEKTISPVLVTFGEVKPACGTCYAKADGGTQLMICAKCKARRYCGRECQKAEWKKHKKVCGMI